MKVADGAQVSLEYTVALEDETVIGSNVGGDPLVYTQGAGEMVPGLERAVAGMAVGDSKEVTLAPDQAYGPVRQEAIHEVPKDKVPEKARRVGAELQAESDEGQPIRAKVVEVGKESVVLDFNHPLAGRTLHFTVKVLGIQPAAG